jgi:hypothetical protein
LVAGKKGRPSFLQKRSKKLLFLRWPGFRASGANHWVEARKQKFFVSLFSKKNRFLTF